MSNPAAQDGSLHLTREQAVLLTSRLFAAYLLFWAIDDFTAFPREILAITHYIREIASVLGTNTSLPQPHISSEAISLSFSPVSSA